LAITWLGWIIEVVAGQSKAEASTQETRRTELSSTVARRELHGVLSQPALAEQSAGTEGPSSQRDRILAAIVTAAGCEGYAAVTVGQIIALACVSRSTFYEYFPDKEDCFLTALAPIRRRLLVDVAHAVQHEPPERATAAAVAALVSFASSYPRSARLFMSELLAGGVRARDAHDVGIAEMAELIDAARGQVPSEVAVPDLASRLLLGAVCRLLACRMARGEPVLSDLCGELLAWIESYSQPAGEHRWGTLQPAFTPGRSPFLPHSPLRAPAAPAFPRARIPEDALAEYQSLRIMFATAEIVQRDGYCAATVAEITRRAGVDGRAFYRSFAGKQEAFAAATELLFRHVMAAAAAAFVTGESWPHRVWEAARAITQCVEQNPTLAQVSLIESHAVGSVAVQRAADLACAFTIFLQEGYRHESRHGCPSTLALEAIATTVFELGYQQARRENANVKLSGLSAHVAFIALAPFIGAAEANAFLDHGTRSHAECASSVSEQQPRGHNRHDDRMLSGAA
jgi:AcrR family transcriptional regulator